MTNNRGSTSSNHELFGVPLHCHTSRYEMMEKIGKGEGDISYWVAWDAVEKERTAVTRVIRGANDDEHIKKVMNNQTSLLHPHITQMREVVAGKSSLDVVMDFAPGRDLAYYVDHFAPLTERHARHFFQQLVIAVDFCHRRRLCVGNIRLDKLTLNAELDIVKLQNPTLSKDFVEQFQSRNCMYACDYASPKAVNSGGVGPEDGYAVDVWAIGVCLFALLYGYMPFSDEKHDTDVTRARIIDGDLQIPDHHIVYSFQKVPISADCLDLLHCLLEHDPQKRMTVPEILHHSWFLEGLPPGARELNDSIELAAAALPDHGKRPKKTSVVRRLLSCGSLPIKWLL